MITVAIITVSDRSSRGERDDLSGPAIEKWAVSQNYLIKEKIIIPDEKDLISAQLTKFSDENINLILTTGGTGFAKRDVTPEATRAVIQKEAPGFGEAMRASSLKITPHAMLSRAIAGIRNNSLIINLPGSPKGAIENLQAIEKALPHAISLLNGEVTDCGKPN